MQVSIKKKKISERHYSASGSTVLPEGTGRNHKSSAGNLLASHGKWEVWSANLAGQVRSHSSLKSHMSFESQKPSPPRTEWLPLKYGVVLPTLPSVFSLSSSLGNPCQLDLPRTG